MPGRLIRSPRLHPTIGVDALEGDGEGHVVAVERVVNGEARDRELDRRVRL